MGEPPPEEGHVSDWRGIWNGNLAVADDSDGESQSTLPPAAPDWAAALRSPSEEQAPEPKQRATKQSCAAVSLASAVAAPLPRLSCFIASA
jgi:hypothetical protein